MSKARKRRRRAGLPAVCVGYVRVSTDQQELSPEAQRSELAAWATAQGSELVGIAEDTCSGATSIEDRPGLLEALELVREHRAGVLLVVRRDRLARSVLVAALVEHLLEYQGARVVAADGGGEVDGPEGKLLRVMLDAFAELERVRIGQRTRSALQAKRRRGERVSGPPPYGFRHTRAGMLEAEPEEQTAIRSLRRWRGRGLSIRRCVELLGERGHPARGERWHTTTVARLCKREGV